MAMQTIIVGKPKITIKGAEGLHSTHGQGTKNFPTSEKMKGLHTLAKNKPAISIGKNKTRIMGIVYDNTEGFSRNTVMHFFNEIPSHFHFDVDSLVNVKTVARHLQRIGAEGLKAMEEGSLIVSSKKRQMNI